MESEYMLIFVLVEYACNFVFFLAGDASYFAYCANETVHGRPGLCRHFYCFPAGFIFLSQGVEYPGVPDVAVPIVADMSSNFLSKVHTISFWG